jgi:5-methylcytosine-specific restriction endonuclease McrA
MKSGQNKINEYLARIRQNHGVEEVFCKHCEEWKEFGSFHLSKGRYKSMCKACHAARYSVAAGYRSPSVVKRSERAKAVKEQWLSQEQTCTACGQTKPRAEFYSERQKKYLPYCCSTRRNADEIQRDIDEQMKTCFGCGLRFPFDEFINSPQSRDGKRPYCKCCDAARLKVYSDKPGRTELIKQTDDGTLSIGVLSNMLRNADSCAHCGVKMTTSYPVTRTNKTIDHDVPLTRGGKHSISNIAILCFGCNSSKQDRTMAEFSRVVKKKRQA